MYIYFWLINVNLLFKLCLEINFVIGGEFNKLEFWGIFVG